MVDGSLSTWVNMELTSGRLSRILASSCVTTSWASFRVSFVEFQVLLQMELSPAQVLHADIVYV